MAQANGSIQGQTSEFRQYVPDLNTPRFQIAKEQTPYEYTKAFQTKQQPPWIYNLTETWKELLKDPFIGVTNDGQVRPDIFEAQQGGVDIERVVKAVETALDHATNEQRWNVQYPVNAREWRCWSNPEFLLRPFGLRLEEVPQELRDLILKVIEFTFSAQGYEKALGAMRVNHFLGEVCQVPSIMNEYSYNFLLFGSPSTTESWGWSLYGHHLCLNVFFQGTHISITPTFTGAEPNLIDDGPYKGTEILAREGEIGLELMQSLSPDLQQKAQTYKLLKDPKMLQTGDLKIDRWNQDDQRHLCGAFRDNRVVPYEGICAAGKFDDRQKKLVLDIVEQFVLYLPDQARKLRLQQVEKHFQETYFSWIGGYGDQDAYYFRIQSPVIICEFDHHSGVFLNNTEPAKFHTHTLVRTPNGGDYGNALRREDERVP